MLATVKQLGGRLLLDWHHLGEDADAWLQLDGQGGAATMQLSAIDPDIDFSYDYQDLRFERVADCPPVR